MNNFIRNNIFRETFSTIIAFIVAFIFGGIFISILGKDAVDIYSILFSGTLGNLYGIGQVLFKATPLIFTGLSVSLAFRAGLFNIGAAGQLYIGAILIAITAYVLSSLHWIILIPISVISGFIGGAAWGFIPGYLKAKTGAHEVINTIMLNFIAIALVSYIVNNIFLVPATVHTPEISPNAQIPRLDTLVEGFKGSPVNFSLFAAVLMCFVVYYLINKTKLGFMIRTTGSNVHAAKYAGINTDKITMVSMALSGGIAGLSGINFVLGYKHYFELGFSETEGFIGIAVALIARNNPFIIIPVAVFFGILEYGGLTINTLVPKELVTILQAIIIISIISIHKIIEKLYIMLRKVQIG